MSLSAVWLYHRRIACRLWLLPAFMCFDLRFSHQLNNTDTNSNGISNLNYRILTINCTYACRISDRLYNALSLTRLQFAILFTPVELQTYLIIFSVEYITKLPHLNRKKKLYKDIASHQRNVQPLGPVCYGFSYEIALDIIPCNKTAPHFYIETALLTPILKISSQFTKAPVYSFL